MRFEVGMRFGAKANDIDRSAHCNLWQKVKVAQLLGVSFMVDQRSHGT